MNDGRIGITTFCDDVRQELGNKFSLMGCYGGEVLVEAFPLVLSKFCAVVRVSTPIGRPFCRLTVRASLDDDLLAELDIPADQLDREQKKPESIPDSEDGRFVMQAILVFSPFGLQQKSKLRVVAETEEGILKVGTVTFRERSTDERT